MRALRHRHWSFDEAWAIINRVNHHPRLAADHESELMQSFLTKT
jgi:hypothetical protein